MASGEHINQPPFYEELFTGFAGMAAARGTINYDPLDSALAPGNDGTLTPDGERAFAYDYEISSDALPQAIREMDIDRVEVASHTRRIYDSRIWPERVIISIYKTWGLTQMIEFRKKSGVITAYQTVSASNEAFSEIGQGLGDEEKDEIMQDILNHRNHWLEQEGPAGEFARSLFVILNASDDVGVEDIDMLRKIQEELNKQV